MTRSEERRELAKQLYARSFRGVSWAIEPADAMLRTADLMLDALDQADETPTACPPREGAASTAAGILAHAVINGSRKRSDGWYQPCASDGGVTQDAGDWLRSNAGWDRAEILEFATHRSIWLYRPPEAKGQA